MSETRKRTGVQTHDVPAQVWLVVTFPPQARFIREVCIHMAHARWAMTVVHVELGIRASTGTTLPEGNIAMSLAVNLNEDGRIRLTCLRGQ